jgi:uncharacterized protein YbbC (DUF1343 family)
MSYLHGIERAEALDKALLNKRIGLITNPTGVDRNLKSTIDILSDKYRVCALYAAEHGVRGNIQAGGRVDTYVDEKTGLKVYSLYQNEPTDKMLADIDVILYDMQDVGVRFYTYIYTLTSLMEAAARYGKSVIVLDRYNPIGLTRVEGALLRDEFTSGVGKYGLPARYALTVGELARYVNDVGNINCELTVIPCKNLKRSDDFRTLGVDWVLPSPNLPSYESALAYVGTVLMEGTNMSEGRGTTKPFEMLGAPYLRSAEVIKYIASLNLKGFKLRECCFTPTFSKHAGELCRGFQIHITDADSFEPFALCIFMLDYIRKTHSELTFRKDFFNKLLGTDEFFSDNFNAESFINEQNEALKSFATQIKGYFIY